MSSFLHDSTLQDHLVILDHVILPLRPGVAQLVHHDPLLLVHGPDDRGQKTSQPHPVPLCPREGQALVEYRIIQDVPSFATRDLCMQPALPLHHLLAGDGLLPPLQDPVLHDKSRGQANRRPETQHLPDKDKYSSFPNEASYYTPLIFRCRQLSEDFYDLIHIC